MVSDETWPYFTETDDGKKLTIGEEFARNLERLLRFAGWNLRKPWPEVIQHIPSEPFFWVLHCENQQNFRIPHTMTWGKESCPWAFLKRWRRKVMSS